MTLSNKEIDNAVEKVYPADFQEVVSVWEASVRATHHFLQEKDIQYFKPLILNEYLKLVDLFCIRNPDEQMLGFIGVAGNKIEMLFVHPAAFGKGIGKKLLSFSVRTLGANEVDVNEQNEQAVGFYLHVGFRITGRSELDSLGKPFPLLHLKLAAEQFPNR